MTFVSTFIFITLRKYTNTNIFKNPLAFVIFVYPSHNLQHLSYQHLDYMHHVHPVNIELSFHQIYPSHINILVQQQLVGTICLLFAVEEQLTTFIYKLKIEARMLVNKIKFSKNNSNYNFYFPINGKKQTESFKKMLLGYTYPVVENFHPKLILDVGANVGATSMFFAINYPNARIFSFEPTEMNFRWLQKNTESFKNITRIKKGAYFKDTTAKIYLDSESGGRNSIYKGWTKSERYETVIVPEEDVDKRKPKDNEDEP